MIVAGADVRVAAQLVAFAAHHQGELAVGFEAHDAVHYVHACAFEFAGPRDVCFLVETGFDFDEGNNLLTCFCRLNEGVYDGGVAAGAVQGLLDCLHTRVGCGLGEERLHTGGERVVGVVQQHIVVTCCGEYVRFFSGFGGVEPAGGVGNMFWVVQGGPVGAHNCTHTAQV